MREKCSEYEYEYEEERRPVRPEHLLVLVLVGCGSGKTVRAPGETARERSVARDLRAHVQMLAGRIGERNHGRPRALAQAWRASW